VAANPALAAVHAAMDAYDAELVRQFGDQAQAKRYCYKEHDAKTRGAKLAMDMAEQHWDRVRKHTSWRL
jgi:hypothetical protein